MIEEEEKSMFHMCKGMRKMNVYAPGLSGALGTSEPTIIGSCVLIQAYGFAKLLSNKQRCFRSAYVIVGLLEFRA